MLLFENGKYTLPESNVCIKLCTSDYRLLPVSEGLNACAIPLLGNVTAGYPAEAYNYIEDGLDLNKYIMRDKENTRSLWATHNGLTGYGIDFGDLLVIDSSIKPKQNSIYLFKVDGELTLRRIQNHVSYIELLPFNNVIQPIQIKEGETLETIGVLTHVIKKFCL